MLRSAAPTSTASRATEQAQEPFKRRMPLWGVGAIGGAIVGTAVVLLNFNTRVGWNGFPNEIVLNVEPTKAQTAARRYPGQKAVVFKIQQPGVEPEAFGIIFDSTVSERERRVFIDDLKQMTAKPLDSRDTGWDLVVGDRRLIPTEQLGTVNVVGEMNAGELGANVREVEVVAKASKLKLLVTNEYRTIPVFFVVLGLLFGGLEDFLGRSRKPKT